MSATVREREPIGFHLKIKSIIQFCVHIFSLHVKYSSCCMGVVDVDSCCSAVIKNELQMQLQQMRLRMIE